MNAVAAHEWDQFSRSFPGACQSATADGSILVSIASVDLSGGWSMASTPVWFVAPVGYPAAQPDCFWADPDLRLESGAIPSNTGQQTVPGLAQRALWFSWHVTAWRPGHDTLTSYMRFIQRRFSDAR